MSLPNNTDSSQQPKLPDSIKIDDITSGKIDPNLIYQEIERLKAEINILRNDMSMFLKAIVTIKPNQSQQEYYVIIASRLNTIRTSIKEYCEKYNKLLPIINLAQIKLGHEVEAPPPSLNKSGVSTSNNNTPDLTNRSIPSTTTTTTTGSGSIKVEDKLKKNGKKSSVSNKSIGNSSSSPIVL